MKSISLRNALLATVLVAAGYAATSSAAQAANVTVTWDPAALVPPLTSPFPGGGEPVDSNITFNNITNQDFGVVVVDPVTGHFSEQTLVNFNSFNLGGSTVTTLGLVTGSESFYIAFQGLGVQTSGSVSPTPTSPIGGSFTSGSFELYVANGKAALNTVTSGCGTASPTSTSNTNCGGTVSGLTNVTEIATGTVESGTTTLANTSGNLSAGANIITTFTPTAAAQAAGFYVSPDTYLDLQFFTSVTNTGSVLTAVTGVSPSGNNLLVIGNGTTGGGGGNSTFEKVPEPASLLLLGSGLLGLGAVGARRRKSA